MPSVQSWFRFGDFLLPVTAAGPLVSPTVASAAVIRLRQASQWIDGPLADISGLPGAAAKVTASPVLVVDRHGLARALQKSLDASEERTPVSTRAGLGIMGVMKSFISDLPGLWWDNDRRSQMLLVAPNVWQTAVNNRFDHADFAKWTALRTGLWGAYFTQAPWLGSHFQSLLQGDDEATEELTRTIVLLSQVISAQLERITPQQIPSINWIRQREPHSALVELLHQLRRFDLAVPDTVGMQALSNGFVQATGLARADGTLTTLLAAPEQIPTAEELSRPTLWLQRVGVD